MEDNIPSRLLPPEVEKFRKIDTMMGTGTDYRPLAHLTQGQIQAVSLFKALDQYFKDSGIDDGLKHVMIYLEDFEHLSPSMDRMGRQEIVTMLKSVPAYAPSPLVEAEEKTPWWKFWAKSEAPGK